MVRDEWARPRYEHRDIRAEYSWRGSRGRSRGWKRRGRWRPRFDRRRWDEDRPSYPDAYRDDHRSYDSYDERDHPMNNSNDSYSQDDHSNVPAPSENGKLAASLAGPSTEHVNTSRESTPVPKDFQRVNEPNAELDGTQIPDQKPEARTEPKQEVQPQDQVQIQDQGKSNEKFNKSTQIDAAAKLETSQSPDSDATDEDDTIASAKALRIVLPPTQLESALMEVYSQLPKARLRYLKPSIGVSEHQKPPHPSAAVVARIKRRQRQVQLEIESARAEFKEIRENWLIFCASLDESAAAASSGSAPTSSGGAAVSSSSPTDSKYQNKTDTTALLRAHSGSSRRNRSHGDAVRSEAEFMEILANLELETARDPLIRAQLTSVVAPAQIFDPVELKSLYFDTNNLITDKSSLAKRLELDGVDTFTEQEHQRFCDAYLQFPKQFGKISAVMGGFRTFHECVMHYYRTKHVFDYKQMLQKRRPKGRRGRKPKKPRVEDMGIAEQSKPDDSVEDTNMSVENQPMQDVVPLEPTEPPLLPETTIEPAGLLPVPKTVAKVEKEAPVELVPAAEFEQKETSVTHLPPPESPSTLPPQLPPVTAVLGEESARITTELAHNAAMVAMETTTTTTESTVDSTVEPDTTTASVVTNPASNSQVPVAEIIIKNQDPDATVDEPIKKISPVNETPIKPKVPLVASSTPMRSLPLPLPVRTPQNIPKRKTIPPPVQPLSGTKQADPMSAIDALATLALEIERTGEDKTVKGRKTRRRKGASKPTSYWNAAETKKFETLLGLFGTKWEEIAKHIQSKSAIMLKNHYTKYKSAKGYAHIVEKADERIAKTGVLPVYVSADPEEDDEPAADGSTLGASTDTPNSGTEPTLTATGAAAAEVTRRPDTGGSTTPAGTPGGTPGPTPGTTSGNTTPTEGGAPNIPLPAPSSATVAAELPQIANGPPSGFFEPRQRQVPVQSSYPEDIAVLETGAVSNDQQVSQPPRPFVRPRTSMLASILREGAELPRPNTNFMEADSYKMDAGLPFMGNTPYRESNERGHN